MLNRDYSDFFTHILAACLGATLSYSSAQHQELPFFSENSVLYLFAPQRLHTHPQLIQQGHSYYLAAVKDNSFCLLSKKTIRYVHNHPLIMVEVDTALISLLHQTKKSRLAFHSQANYPLCKERSHHVF
jgi:hypothetical protein